MVFSRMSVGSGIDVDCTERGNCHFDGVSQDRHGVASRRLRTFYGYGYACATGTDTGVRAGVDVNLFMYPTFSVHVCMCV